MDAFAADVSAKDNANLTPMATLISRHKAHRPGIGPHAAAKLQVIDTLRAQQQQQQQQQLRIAGGGFGGGAYGDDVYFGSMEDAGTPSKALEGSPSAGCVSSLLSSPALLVRLVYLKLCT